MRGLTLYIFLLGILSSAENADIVALMVMSKEFGRRGRRVVRLEDFTDEEMALIAKTEASAENVSLDAELKDWKQK